MKLLFYLNFHHIMFFTVTKIYASNLKILFVSGITYIISAEHGIFFNLILLKSSERIPYSPSSYCCRNHLAAQENNGQ